MRDCFVRACKANKEGHCSKAEWIKEGCAMTWFFTGKKPQPTTKR